MSRITSALRDQHQGVARLHPIHLHQSAERRSPFVVQPPPLLRSIRPRLTSFRLSRQTLRVSVRPAQFGGKLLRQLVDQAVVQGAHLLMHGRESRQRPLAPAE